MASNPINIPVNIGGPGGLDELMDREIGLAQATANVNPIIVPVRANFSGGGGAGFGGDDEDDDGEAGSGIDLGDDDGRKFTSRFKGRPAYGSSRGRGGLFARFLAYKFATFGVERLEKEFEAVDEVGDEEENTGREARKKYQDYAKAHTGVFSFLLKKASEFQGIPDPTGITGIAGPYQDSVDKETAALKDAAEKAEKVDKDKILYRQIEKAERETKHFAAQANISDLQARSIGGTDADKDAYELARKRFEISEKQEKFDDEMTERRKLAHDPHAIGVLDAEAAAFKGLMDAEEREAETAIAMHKKKESVRRDRIAEWTDISKLTHQIQIEDLQKAFDALNLQLPNLPNVNAGPNAWIPPNAGAGGNAAGGRADPNAVIRPLKDAADHLERSAKHLEKATEPKADQYHVYP